MYIKIIFNNLKRIMEGPKIEVNVTIKCTDCKYFQTLRYNVQGDIGYDAFCKYKNESGKFIGSDSRSTPKWCHFLKENKTIKKLNDFSLNIDSIK